MTEEKKPIVHELKAGDFILDAPTVTEAEWQPMDSFPRDGHVVEVRAGNVIARAIWNTTIGRVEYEPGNNLEQGLEYEWREIAP
jgi:hypothetical protein